MKKLKITVQIGDKQDEFLFIRNNHDYIPDEDFILREYSYHYHMATQRSLPANAKIIDIEELNA